MSEVTAASPGRRATAARSTGRVLSAGDYAERLAVERANRGAPGSGFQKLPTLHDEAKRHGYQQGLQRALTDVEAALRELRRYRSDRDQWLQAYVLAILGNVLREQEPASLVPAIAQQAIVECERRFDTLAVHVHPEVASVVAKRLRAASGEPAESATCVDVVADDRLDETQCEVHTPFGIIDAGLENQLEALVAIVAAAGRGES